MITYGKKCIKYLLNYLINFKGLTQLHLEHRMPLIYVSLTIQLTRSTMESSNVSININSFLVVQMVKNLHAIQETWVRSLGREDPLEEGKATHSNILAWRIPWTEKPGRLHSPWGHTVGHNWMTNFLLSHIFYSLLKGTLKVWLTFFGISESLFVYKFITAIGQGAWWSEMTS